MQWTLLACVESISHNNFKYTRLSVFEDRLSGILSRDDSFSEIDNTAVGV